MEENEVKQVNTESTQLKFNGIAIASFVCSLVGIFYFMFPCGVAALATGIIGVVKFNPATEKGKWMAITGLTIGAVEILIVLLAIFGLFALASLAI